MFELTGRTAVVTGSGRGLGRAIAEGLAAAGARVVVCARHLEEAQQTAETIVASGGAAHAVRTDVADERSCAHLIEAAVETFGRLDVLVNNAGVEINEPADTTSAETWERTLAVNVGGAMSCARFAAAAMTDGGSIVNVSSMAGTIAMPNVLAYSASKAALDQATRVLALEWAPRGIRVNAVAPGYMENVMRDGFMTDLEKVRAFTPLGRRGRSDELVGPVVFLASEASSYVTGTVLRVDGGTTAV